MCAKNCARPARVQCATRCPYTEKGLNMKYKHEISTGMFK